MSILVKVGNTVITTIAIAFTKETNFDDSFHKQSGSLWKEDSTYFERPFSFVQSFKKVRIPFCLHTNKKKYFFSFSDYWINYR